MSLLPSMSLEQAQIITNIGETNVVTDSVAGCGKTTTNLYIARAYPNIPILLLTYNAKLKLETREKVKINEIENMEVHSYHSFAVKYYLRTAYTDTGIKKVIANDKPPMSLFSFGLIIVDEAQDMTPLLYRLTYKIYRDNNMSAVLCIMGDQNQSIYDFNGADSRFIELAPQLFAWNKYAWAQLRLSVSYRVTRPMADFVNDVMYGYEHMKAAKGGSLPRYIICDTFGTDPWREVKSYLRSGYTYEDIFILAPSVKSVRSPIRILANRLSAEGVPLYVPISDTERPDQEVLRGKLALSTFHQVKGLERKVILVFGFDASYFKFYKKFADPRVCPNEMYVAATRALEKITFFHHYTNDYLPFLRTEMLSKRTEIVSYMQITAESVVRSKQMTISVTDLLRHIPQDTIDMAISYLNIEELAPAGHRINIPIKITDPMSGTVETVSDINGIAIPAHFEYHLTGRMTIRTAVLKEINNSNSEYKFDGGFTEKIKIFSKMDIPDLLYIANLWSCISNGYAYKMSQIKNYDWISSDKINECLERMKSLGIGKEAKFEKYLARSGNELLGRSVAGYADIMTGINQKDKFILYELKCVSELTSLHFIQAAVYNYLAEPLFGIHDTRVYNILTGQMFRISPKEPESLAQMMTIIILKKYGKPKKINDADFIKMHNIFQLGAAAI